MPQGKPGSKDRSGPFRHFSLETRMFRLAVLQDPEAGAAHLRRPCREGHPVTLGNTVRIGRAGYHCRLCRRAIALKSLHRRNTVS